MSRDYFIKKEKEIRSKNIDKREKKKELKSLTEEKSKVINSSKKRENIECILIIIMFLLIYPAMILGKKFTKNIRIVLGCIITMIGISYLLYRIYKIFKNELNKKYWKSLFDLEIKELKIKYEELFFCNNDALKKKRDKVIISKIIVLTGIVIPLVIFYYVCKLNLNNSELITLFFIIMYILLIYLLTNKERKCIESFKSLYKWDVISKYIGNINSELIYEESLLNFAKVETDYKYAEFDIVDNTSIWETKCEDYIFGKLNDNTYMEMSDIISKEIIRRRRAGGTIMRFLLFKGNFISLNINKKFEECKIIKNKLNVFDKNELINTDNEKFNKYFEIHAQDKDTVQSYLTPSLIDFLADFREKYKIDFEIIFKDKIYIRFFTGNMFEPKIFGKIIDEISIYKYYVITKFVKELVEKLNIL